MICATMVVTQPPDTLVLRCGEGGRHGVRDLDCYSRESSEFVRARGIKMDSGDRKYNDENIHSVLSTRPGWSEAAHLSNSIPGYPSSFSSSSSPTAPNTVTTGRTWPFLLHHPLLSNSHLPFPLPRTIVFPLFTWVIPTDTSNLNLDTFYFKNLPGPTS